MKASAQWIHQISGFDCGKADALRLAIEISRVIWRLPLLALAKSGDRSGWQSSLQNMFIRLTASIQPGIIKANISDDHIAYND